jgi:hypothetical protein
MARSGLEPLSITARFRHAEAPTAISGVTTFNSSAASQTVTNGQPRFARVQALDGDIAYETQNSGQTPIDPTSGSPRILSGTTEFIQFDFAGDAVLKLMPVSGTVNVIVTWCK